MSYEVQYSIARIHNNPVRKSATERRFEAAYSDLEAKIRQMENGEDYSYLFYNITERDEILSAFDRYVESYKSMIDSLAVPLLDDPILSNTIKNIIQTATPEDISSGVAKEEIIRVVDVYLSETSGNIESGYTAIYTGVGVIGVLVIGGVIYRVMRRKRVA